MKRWLSLFLVLVLLVSSTGCAASCGEKDEQMLYILSQSGSVSSAKRSDGDLTLGGFGVHWNLFGCVVSLGDKKTQVFTNRKKNIRFSAIPLDVEVEAYLTFEGNDLPASWNARIENWEQREQAKAEYGIIENYIKARDSEHELEIIQNAFNQAGLNLQADKWYQVFLETTWTHGDLSFKFDRAEARDRTSYIELKLNDSDENTMILTGIKNDFVDMVFLNDELIGGPYTG